MSIFFYSRGHFEAFLRLKMMETHLPPGYASLARVASPSGRTRGRLPPHGPPPPKGLYSGIYA